MATDNTERLLGEISSDVKHILTRQDKQDARLDRQDARLSAVEGFQWKLAGIASVVPTVLATIALAMKYNLPQ